MNTKLAAILFVALTLGACGEAVVPSAAVAPTASTGVLMTPQASPASPIQSGSPAIASPSNPVAPASASAAATTASTPAATPVPTATPTAVPTAIPTAIASAAPTPTLTPTTPPSLPPESPAPETAATQTCIAAFAAGDSTLALKVLGVDRSAIVHVPKGLATVRRAVPVVITFPGYEESAASIEKESDFDRLAEQHGFVAVYPEEVFQETWNFAGTPSQPAAETQDLAFVAALLDRLEASGCIDPRRVYLSGVSNGGGEVNELACRMASRVAAVAVVSGEIFAPPCVPERAMPIVFFHALADKVILYAGGLVEGTTPSTPPIETTVRAWANNNGCYSPDTTGLNDGIVELSWTNCVGPVVLYRLPAGSHGWGDAAIVDGKSVMNITDVAWAFLSHFALP